MCIFIVYVYWLIRLYVPGYSQKEEAKLEAEPWNTSFFQKSGIIYSILPIFLRWIKIGAFVSVKPQMEMSYIP